MNERPIQVGDLVQVVRPSSCCGRDDYVGRVFAVAEISGLGGFCAYCGHMSSGISYREKRDTDGIWIGFPRYRLKRIPPLEELEGELAQNEIKNPMNLKEPA